MNYKSWDIVYIKFPFTDLTNYKLRPALIISNNKFNSKNNVILLWIFWSIWISEFSLIIEDEDLLEWKMKKQSFFRFQNIFTLDKKLIERRVWILKKEKLKIIINKINSYISLD